LHYFENAQLKEKAGEIDSLWFEKLIDTEIEINET
jgi:hypothetical protein